MSSKKCQSTKVAGPDRKLQRDSRLDCREAARKLKGTADRLQARLQRGCWETRKKLQVGCMLGCRGAAMRLEGNFQAWLNLVEITLVTRRA